MTTQRMEIRELAERVLFGTSLEEKLIQAPRLTDEEPGAARDTPASPGRPTELRLDRWNEQGRVSFNDVGDLQREEERGLVLHFFANHELLAAELMALVLLKFPDAPAKFRRGVAQTLKDEQEHVRLYLQRMQAAGVEFGQIPVSDFFWRAIAPMPSPMDFVTRLSLTLEQANLDYAPHYRQLFDDAGDSDTAQLLERIYKDEIGHVKHGLNWFNTWRAPTQSEWDAFAQALAPPMSPSRAKGIGQFNRDGRRQAGLPESFIDELEVFSRSHGRCPDLYWFNPACDLAAPRGAGYTPPAAVRDLAHDLAMVPGLLCAADDIVVVPQRPSLAFLQSWKAAGWHVPELVEWDPAESAAPATLQRRLTRLQPWGWSIDSDRALQPLQAQLPASASATTEWNADRQSLYRKSWSAAWLGRILPSLREGESDWLCSDDVAGISCDNADAAQAALQQIAVQGWGRGVIKADYGTAGGQQAVVDSADNLPEHRLAWLQGVLRDVGAVVVEPWLDRRIDLSAQYEIEEGQVRLLGFTRFLTDEAGRFQGVFVHNMVANLSAEERRFLYGDGRDGRRLQRVFQRVGDALQADWPSGLSGPVGVDALVYRAADDELRLKPVVEVNPRFAMGRVSLALQRRVLAARTAVWRLVRVRDIERRHGSVAAWVESAHRERPLEMTADGQQISRGVVFTNEPQTARSVIGVLAVGETWDEIATDLG